MKRFLYIVVTLGVVFYTTTPSLMYAGQLGDWSIINNLNVARAGNVAVIANDTIIYTFGGFEYTTTPYPVEKNIIHPNGTLSTWMIESSQMVYARGKGLGFATDSYVYALGAQTFAASSTVERTFINIDGTLGQWSIIGQTPIMIYGASGVKYQNFFYVIGGWYASPDIYRTTINPDGSLGTWIELTSKLNEGRHDLTSILIDSTIYVTGGVGLGGLKRTVELAYILPDGNLSSFITISTTIGPHVSGGLFYDTEYLTIVGGQFSSIDEERARLYPDGSLGSWESRPGNQVERYEFGYTQTSKGAYIVGGFNGSDLSSVEYAPIIGVTGINRKEWEIFE